MLLDNVCESDHRCLTAASNAINCRENEICRLGRCYCKLGNEVEAMVVFRNIIGLLLSIVLTNALLIFTEFIIISNHSLRLHFFFFFSCLGFLLHNATRRCVQDVCHGVFCVENAQCHNR